MASALRHGGIYSAPSPRVICRGDEDRRAVQATTGAMEQRTMTRVANDPSSPDGTAGPARTLLHAASRSRPYADLFLISFLLLFFELACIRWFGSTVVFLTFFTNIALLATFLGMSVGCLAASSRRDWTGAVIPILIVAAVLAYATLWTYNHFGRIMVDVGGQGSPQQVYFGTEYRARDVAAFVVPIELLAAVFFVLIALVFVGVGQVMGRAFNQAPDRLVAYIANIAGSLAGIAAFALASSLRMTPMMWFAVVGMIWVYFLPRPGTLQLGTLLLLLVFTGVFSYRSTLWDPYQKSPRLSVVMWSPYYKIYYTPSNRLIETNNIGHQAMVAPQEGGPGYELPHLLNRDAGGKPFEDVLIIGAGSGNDVAAALANGAKHVDAVEIDPAIYDIGRAEHPDRPYQDPRVAVHIDDGRSFLRKTDRQYDLVIYALVDSLVLHSGYSSIRLESFLFTQQAFEDIAARLKPSGVFAAYNIFRQGWIIGRIQRMAERAFGPDPLVMSMPHVDSIHAEDRRSSRITFILASRDPAALVHLRREFAARQSFWLNSRSVVNQSINGFGPTPPSVEGSQPANWNRIAPTMVATHGINRVPTDDWPFLYLREPSIPALNVRSMIVIALASMGILYLLSPVRRVRPNWQMFFLGAGFMLLETKGVVHMALLFGATWIVNSVVFFAILVMILTSNLFVLAVRPAKLWVYYVLLVAALLLNVAVPMSTFLALPGSTKVLLSCAVVFAPIFFAGVVFGASFRDSVQPDVDFGSNIAGAILGGLAESLALVVGFNYLLVVAVVFYILSAVLRPSVVAPVPAVRWSA
jgi:spermidine synthase